MPVLSIIIPIYNTPTDALQRCFDSIATLGKTNYEVLLIDDGSQSPTGQFCQAYAAEHPAFVYHFKENGGVSSARNLGLDKASGTYIMFLDADDMLLGEPVAEYLQGQQADLTVFDMQLQENGKEQTWPSLTHSGGQVDKLVFFHQLLSGKSLNSPCVKLFRRSLIQAEKLRFSPELITGEDWMFVTCYSLLADSFAYVPVACYRYFRDESTGSSRLARFPDRMLGNYTVLHSKRMQLIDEQPFCPQEQLSLRSNACVILTEDLFNSAAELLLCKQLTCQRRSLILDSVRTARTHFYNAPVKTRIKAFVLLRFFPGLWLLAKLRQLYLKLK